MRLFGAFLVSLAAASLATALPTDNHGRTSVLITHNLHSKAHGPLALAKAHCKFNKPVHKDVAAAVFRLRKRATGSVANVPQVYDSQYLAAVQIGTPSRTLQLDFNTGSSDLWVFST